MMNIKTKKEKKAEKIPKTKRDPNTKLFVVFGVVEGVNKWNYSNIYIRKISLFKKKFLSINQENFCQTAIVD